MNISANEKIGLSGERHTAWKVSKYEIVSGPYFPVFSQNAGKYGPEKTPYLDTFHAVTKLNPILQIHIYVAIYLKCVLFTKDDNNSFAETFYGISWTSHAMGCHSPTDIVNDRLIALGACLKAKGFGLAMFGLGT